MRSKTLTATVCLITCGTIRGGSFTSYLSHHKSTLSSLQFFGLIP